VHAWRADVREGAGDIVEGLQEGFIAGLDALAVDEPDGEGGGEAVESAVVMLGLGNQGVQHVLCLDDLE